MTKSIADLQGTLRDLSDSHARALHALTETGNAAATALYRHLPTTASGDGLLAQLRRSLTVLIEQVRTDARNMAVTHALAELRAVAGKKAERVSIPMGDDPEPSEVAEYIDNAIDAARDAGEDVASTDYRAHTIIESEATNQYRRARDTAHAALRAMTDKEAHSYGFAVARHEEQFRAVRDADGRRLVPLIGERWNAVADACDKCRAADGELRPFGFQFTLPGPSAHARCRCLRTLWAVGWVTDESERSARPRKRRGARRQEELPAMGNTPNDTSRDGLGGALLRAYTPEEERAASVNEAERTVEVVASTEAVDSYDTILKSSGWDLARYNRNPVVLSCHNTHDIRAIIGTSNTRIEGRKLATKIKFLPEGTSDESDLAFELFRTGALKGVSVGFIPRAWEDKDIDGRSVRVFTEMELVEISAVPVPANPEALARAMRELKAKEPAAMTDEATPVVESVVVEPPSPDVAALLDAATLRVAELELRLDAMTKERDAALERANAADTRWNEHVATQRAAEVDGLIKAGRVPESKRDSALRLLTADEAAFREIYPPQAPAAPMAHLLQRVVPAVKPERAPSVVSAGNPIVERVEKLMREEKLDRDAAFAKAFAEFDRNSKTSNPADQL